VIIQYNMANKEAVIYTIRFKTRNIKNNQHKNQRTTLREKEKK